MSVVRKWSKNRSTPLQLTWHAILSKSWEFTFLMMKNRTIAIPCDQDRKITDQSKSNDIKKFNYIWKGSYN